MRRNLKVIDSLNERFSLMEKGIRGVRTHDKIGTIRKVTGLIIESEGPQVSIGQVCTISSDRYEEKIEAQVVGFQENFVLLMALESVHLIHPGCKVTSKKNSNSVPSGISLLGRVIDGMGRPLDGKGPLFSPMRDGFFNDPPNPLDRGLITETFSTGIKSIDTFTGLFGSGPAYLYLLIEIWSNYAKKNGFKYYVFHYRCIYYT